MHPLRAHARAFALMVLLAPATPASATVTYYYQGHVFTHIDDEDPPTGTFVHTDRVTGFVELAEPLAANLPVTDISALPLSWGFSSGRFSVDSEADQLLLRVSTDNGGRINTWGVEAIMFDADAYNQVGDQFRYIQFVLGVSLGFSNDYDSSYVVECSVAPDCGIETGFEGFVVDNAFNFERPGTWSRLAPGPEPVPALPWGWFAAGGAAFGSALLVARRRLRAATLPVVAR